MIITITHKRRAGSVEITETASVEVQNRESVDNAFDVLARLREQWTQDDALPDKEE